jgi:anti-sigma B factor antagonist
MIAKTETVGGCKILSVSGRIDFESALDFEHHINAMIQEPGDCYIIELSQVELLSSAGLRVMLSTAKRVAHRDASLALAAPNQVVRQVFEISHFDLLFKIFPSVPEAIAALKGTAIAEVQPLESPSVGSQSPSLAAQDSVKPPEIVVSSVEPTAKSPETQNVETELATPLPPSIIRPADTRPPVRPPPLPVPVGDSTQTAASGVAQKAPQAQQPRQTPPPPPVKRSTPASSTPAETGTSRPAGQVTRREAKFPALLEIRAEGTSYPCKDGDVIGTEGQLAKPFFSQITNLAPRHLLIGQSEDRWFVFTPKNVQHPFTMDGVILRAGERKLLQYVEHQVEFSGHVFGFRLVPQVQKKGFFSRLFRRKR